MNTVSEVEQNVIKYTVTDTAIAAMAEEYMPLTVDGIEDKQGLAVVHAARIRVKQTRVDVEKKRKELKASALEYGRKVDGEARRIRELLEPIEAHLQYEEDKVQAEKDRIKEEEAAKRQAALNLRLETLAKLDCMVNPAMVELMTDEKFSETVEEAKTAQRVWQEEQARKAEEAKAEADRLAKERAALERQKKEADEKQRAALARLEAERKADEEAKRVANEKLAKERAALDAERRAVELAKAKADAEEKARIETEQRIAREAAEAKAKEDAEVKELARLDALRPDKEKINTVANTVASVAVPELSTLTPTHVIESIRRTINNAAYDIREIAKGL